MNSLLLLPALALALAAQTAVYVTGIEVTGARRLSPAQVVALSGLKTPGAIEMRQIQAAMAGLADTGLVTKVSSSFRNARRSATLILAVEEPPWSMAVVFDNFVGFSDSQLKAAVAALVPTFDGTIPQIPAAADRGRKALEGLARQGGQPGTVSYLPFTNRQMQLRGYRFHLDRASGPLRVCTIELQGAPPALDAELTAIMRSLVAGDYSKDYAERFATENLLPALARQGYLRATIGAIEATQATTPGAPCEGQVRVTVGIAPGVPYAFRGVSWSGNVALTAADLGALLPVTPGAVADGNAVDTGVRAIENAYRNKGYLQASVRPVPTIDDATRQVDYAIAVNEGAQFRMGTLVIAGLDPALTAQLERLWQLGPGAPYDQSYPGRFVADARNRLRQALASYKTQIATRPDMTTQTVTVSITFVQR